MAPLVMWRCVAIGLPFPPCGVEVVVASGVPFPSCGVEAVVVAVVLPFLPLPPVAWRW